MRNSRTSVRAPCCTLFVVAALVCRTIAPPPPPPPSLCRFINSHNVGSGRGGFIVHSSDSAPAAEREIGLWFTEGVSTDGYTPCSLLWTQE